MILYAVYDQNDELIAVLSYRERDLARYSAKAGLTVKWLTEEDQEEVGIDKYLKGE